MELRKQLDELILRTQAGENVTLTREDWGVKGAPQEYLIANGGRKVKKADLYGNVMKAAIETLESCKKDAEVHFIPHFDKLRVLKDGNLELRVGYEFTKDDYDRQWFFVNFVPEEIEETGEKEKEPTAETKPVPAGEEAKKEPAKEEPKATTDAGEGKTGDV